MEIRFEKEYLRQLYEEGKTTDKKYRFQCSDKELNGGVKVDCP